MSEADAGIDEVGGESVASRRAPVVSVVMPAFNTERFIAQAIRSVLRQTFTDWELLIVDDGSTDNTSEVVAGFHDGRIRYFRTSNQGLAAARNHAMRQARGEYVAFLDSDDVWFPPKLAAQMRAFEQDPEVGLVYTNVWRIDPTGHRLSTHRFALDRLPVGYCLDRLVTRLGIIAGGSTVVLKRELLAKTGWFDRTMRAVEDWDFWWRVALWCKFAYVPRALAAYRVRPGTISGGHEAMHAYEEAVIERIYGDPEVRRRFGRRRLVRLRRRAEAHRLYNVGSRALRAGNARRAAASFMESVRTSLHDPRQLVMLMTSFAAMLPLVNRGFLLRVTRK